MRWLRTIIAETVGLFVDDGNFALAIIVWVGIAWAALPRLSISPDWTGIILCAGLVLILVESAVRRAQNP